MSNSTQALIQDLESLKSDQSLLQFIKTGWNALEPGVKFSEGWAVGAICEHLEAVSNGEIRRLLVNVPPGTTKSLSTNVFWPAWEWGPRNNPHLRYIAASYAQALSVRDNVRCRDLLNSEWFQRYWGHQFKFKGDVNLKTNYENTKTGWRVARSVGSDLTGWRADRIIIDDPHSVQGGDSEADRESALRWFSETLPTRLNKQAESAIVVIMQRIHERDVSGLIIGSLKELGYEHLCLPMEYEPDHPHPSTRFTDPRTKLNELLWPERFPRNSIEELKETFRAWGGTYAEAGQLQQRPVPRGGGMFQRDDFEFIDASPTNPRFSVRGWDLAATKDGHGAFSVGLKMSMTAGGKSIIIEDVQRGRWSPGELRNRLKQCADLDGKRCVQSLPQDPGQAGKYQKMDLAAALHGHQVHFSPESGSKEDRAMPLAAQAEAGNLKLVRDTWNDAFLNEACTFPNSQFKDQVDAASRAYSFLASKFRNDSSISFTGGEMFE